MGGEYIVLGILIIIYFASFFKLFEKAGEASWKGFVPMYNFFVWIRILKKPWWWILLLLVPGVNLLVLIILNVLTSRAFNQRELKDHFISALLPFYTIPVLAWKEEHAFVGPIVYDKKKNPKTKAHEWFDALLFAVIAATIIRTFLIEAFTIPTPSMEGSMLVGDYLFVSKVSYGPKMPNTPISFPFAHHTLPLTESTRSYLEWFGMPYYRLPGFGDIERNDVVVFNFPEGDTVLADNQAVSYYSELRNLAWRRSGARTPEEFEAKRGFWMNRARQELSSQHELLVRPPDKRENYIKRCVALPGDELQIINKQVHINGVASRNPEDLQWSYMVSYNSVMQAPLINDEILMTEFGLYQDDLDRVYTHGDNRFWVWHFTQEEANKLMAMGAQLSPNDYSTGGYGPTEYYSNFPSHPSYGEWSNDSYGPVKIPAAGSTVILNEETLPLYERAIRVYENNDLQVKADGIYINGAKTNEYTFQMNYYWMMGDNRHNSQDSRYWGFVPEDHVVGKAVFIWFSKNPDSGVRWDRVFSTVK